ncbi:ATP-binding cassette domain-containing protein [Desulfoscipio sp. XC116]|uniref:ATP-binding cassette domain-containing protein n=1 Tax=Desulfoscipio sp. XC116 TaxID=3144975 RepID=UPI00325BABF7
MGMRQQLGIAQAIMKDPEILIFDEPMNRLDHAGVKEIRDILKGHPALTWLFILNCQVKCYD